MKPTIYFISGPAGVGKSTTATNLVHSIEKSAYVSGDHISHIPVNGRGQPWRSEETLDLTWKNILDICKNLVRVNYNVVIDYVTFNKDLELFLKEIKDLNVRVIYVILMADEETLIYRDKLRPLEKQMGERSLVLLREFRESIKDDRYILDTRHFKENNMSKIVEDIKHNLKYVVVS